MTLTVINIGGNHIDSLEGIGPLKSLKQLLANDHILDDIGEITDILSRFASSHSHNRNFSPGRYSVLAEQAKATMLMGPVTALFTTMGFYDVTQQLSNDENHIN